VSNSSSTGGPHKGFGEEKKKPKIIETKKDSTGKSEGSGDKNPPSKGSSSDGQGTAAGCSPKGIRARNNVRKCHRGETEEVEISRWGRGQTGSNKKKTARILTGLEIMLLGGVAQCHS